MSDHLKDIVIVAKKAGAYIKKEREHFSNDKIEIKGLNDMVSYVDKASEKLIVEELSKILPEAGFIVEENSAQGRKDYNWIVDPLDSTVNFIHGIPSYAVSIALEYKGEVIEGVVYEVGWDECFFAAKGKGAFLNDKKIQVSQIKTLSGSLIGTGFPSSNFAYLDNQLEAIKYFLNNTDGIRRMGVAAADLCYVAAGRMDAFFQYNLAPWDVAAGGLIVQEAGGTTTDFSGGGDWLFGKEICCTNGLLKEEFGNIIKKQFEA